MKASDFPVDTRVVLKHETSRKGIVIGNKLSDSDEVVAVEWDSGDLLKVNVNDLMPEKTLDEEFHALLMEKIEAAAALLGEANALAKTKGYRLRDLEYDDDGETDVSLYPILKQINAGGWSTSSMGC